MHKNYKFTVSGSDIIMHGLEVSWLPLLCRFSDFYENIDTIWIDPLSVSLYRPSYCQLWTRLHCAIMYISSCRQTWRELRTAWQSLRRDRDNATINEAALCLFPDDWVHTSQCRPLLSCDKFSSADVRVFTISVFNVYFPFNLFIVETLTESSHF